MSAHDTEICRPIPASYVPATSMMPSVDDIFNYAQKVESTYCDTPAFPNHGYPRPATDPFFSPYTSYPESAFSPFQYRQPTRRSTCPYPPSGSTESMDSSSSSSLAAYDSGRSIAPLPARARRGNPPTRPHNRRSNTLPTKPYVSSVSDNRPSSAPCSTTQAVINLSPVAVTPLLDLETKKNTKANGRGKKRSRDSESLSTQSSDTDTRKGTIKKPRIPRTAWAEPDITYPCQWVTNGKVCGEKHMVIHKTEESAGRRIWQKHLLIHLGLEDYKSQKKNGKGKGKGKEEKQDEPPPPPQLKYICQWRQPNGLCKSIGGLGRLGRHIVEDHYGKNDNQCPICGQIIKGGLNNLDSHIYKKHERSKAEDVTPSTVDSE